MIQSLSPCLIHEWTIREYYIQQQQEKKQKELTHSQRYRALISLSCKGPLNTKLPQMNCNTKAVTKLEGLKRFPAAPFFQSFFTAGS